MASESRVKLIKTPQLSNSKRTYTILYTNIILPAMELRCDEVNIHSSEQQHV